jgi:hypothetical protein
MSDTDWIEQTERMWYEHCRFFITAAAVPGSYDPEKLDVELITCEKCPASGLCDAHRGTPFVYRRG